MCASLSIPMSLQFGLAGLKQFVPQTIQGLQHTIQIFEENIQIRINIRKWFKENNEIK